MKALYAGCRMLMASTKASKRSQVASFDELDGSLVLKMPIRRIQEDARIGLVSGVEVNDGNPDPVEAPEVRLKACSIWMFTHTWSFAADRFGDRPDRKIQFAGDTCGVQPARFGIEQSRISAYECRRSRHGSHLYMHHSVTIQARQCCV